MIVLHIWPGRWNLPSIDPSCLAAVLYLQCHFPGNFSVAECTNPDLSPSGQLPFLNHEHHVISPLPLIMKYLSALKSATKSDRADKRSNQGTEQAADVAWRAHVESHLGDVVAHVFYGVNENWSKLTHPALASVLPLPQRYYVPQRLRDVHRPRLEASGLWTTSDFEEEEKKSKAFKVVKPKIGGERETHTRIFLREKALEKARTSFDKYARLVENNQNQETTFFGILLAAYLLLLLEPPFPDSSIQSLLIDSYPALVSHARRVQEVASNSCPVEVYPPTGYSWSSVIPWPRSDKGGMNSKTKTDDDIRFERMRWGWIALAAGIAVVYMTTAMKLVAPLPEEGRDDSHEVDVDIEDDEENVDED